MLHVPLFVSCVLRRRNKIVCMQCDYQTNNVN